MNPQALFGSGYANRYHYAGDNLDNIPYLSNFIYDVILCVCFVDDCLSFFLLAIMLSVFLQLMDSDYLFVIFKPFLPV
jgi:hypothetical protein